MYEGQRHGLHDFSREWREVRGQSMGEGGGMHWVR